MNRKVFLECYPDITLAKFLGLKKRQIYHAGNKSEVCKAILKNKNAVGIVDEDPFGTQPGYLKKLNIVGEGDDIKILYDTDSKNYLIVLCPRLEDWILKIAKKERIDFNRFGLKDDSKGLHEQINSNLPKFEKLLAAIPKENKSIASLRKNLLILF